MIVAVAFKISAKGRKVKVALDESENGAVMDWTDGDMEEGVEVDLRKLPKEVQVLRFINSY